MDEPLIANQIFPQTEFIIGKLDFAHIMHFHLTSQNVNFAKNLQGRHFVVGGPKIFKLLSDSSFDSGFQKCVLSSLLLFPCTCYLVDRDNIQ